ncbi:uncharacterized protein NECHADRAFT_30847 [Fusarium vanettenii 77-13-4]|uniref:Amino acid permease/ SLC12A domain-containing protein n=1 Tax=Fusarium vanettenii (strain ATCC MYA-4622 / CBS 123669 / FGSC 9596 / NRRL 45880 / 77-13-4) TaxID=660122 RepID=C7YJU4_FUSV7|nr:uncharacterized protein NECHADRAFT_30847 [Fusarium vanettenii 77-13-4]EEU49037.1 hypothetical protein NECHADRAFT_30847 [Fusarium vanettenii 77-13-4]
MDNKPSSQNGVPLKQTYSDAAGEVVEAGNVDALHRRLGNRQIQLIAIGGSIGTGLFINIGSGLAKAGPVSLLLAMTVYCFFLGHINNTMAEMATLYPVSGGFIRMAGKWVDDAFGFMAGWNFFLYEVLVVPFEITALSIVLTFWRDDIPPASIISAVIASYVILNVLAVHVYGEAEFWLSSGKVLLVFILFGFTFFTMVGVNPQGHAYGFSYWKDPGPFAEWHTTGDLGRFEGFLAALWVASFIVVGPEYISMAAAEAKLPRTYIKNAYKTVYWRFGLFFIGGALCAGIVVPYDDPTLRGILAGTESGAGTATASPYVIAMKNLEIGVLPHITNALIFTSIFSAGNTYLYCGVRSLYGLSLEGRAPKFLSKLTKNGVPIYCVIVSAAFSCLSFLQLSSGTTVVLQWFINLVTAGSVINFIVMCITYIRFYKACQLQGVDRSTFPYRGWFQPYSAYLGLGFVIFVLFGYGYSSFTPWDVTNFFTHYGMVIVAVVTYSSWKIIHKSKVVPMAEMDLVWEKPAIDAYEATSEEIPVGFWTEILSMVGLKRLPKLVTTA